jgi:hypothetical protein
MKNINNGYFSMEEYGFEPFSENDLAMVLGGGGDDRVLDFSTKEEASDNDDALG